MRRRPWHHPDQLTLPFFLFVAESPPPAPADETEDEEAGWEDLASRLAAGGGSEYWRDGAARAWLAGRTGRRGRRCDPRRPDAPGYIRAAAASAEKDHYRWAARVGVGLLVGDEEAA